MNGPAIVRSGPELAVCQARIVVLSIAATWIGELLLFLTYGLSLNSPGNLLGKAIWTLLVCGIAMGATVASLAILLVAGRIDGPRAVIAMAAIFGVVLGLGCNLLCLYLDITRFNYFGGADNPALFFASGLILAPLGGAVVGWLVFTDHGRALVERMSK